MKRQLFFQNVPLLCQQPDVILAQFDFRAKPIMFFQIPGNIEKSVQLQIYADLVNGYLLWNHYYLTTQGLLAFFCFSRILKPFPGVANLPLAIYNAANHLNYREICKFVLGCLLYLQIRILNATCTSCFFSAQTFCDLNIVVFGGCGSFVFLLQSCFLL